MSCILINTIDFNIFNHCYFKNMALSRRRRNKVERPCKIDNNDRIKDGKKKNL